MSTQYSKALTTTCTDTTQASCRQNQLLHDNAITMQANLVAATQYDKPPADTGGARTVSAGGRIGSEPFLNPPLVVRVSWMSLLTAGTLFVLYGLVKR